MSARPPVSGDRARLLSYLGDQLIGPVAGERETLSEAPEYRYTSGILFPFRATDAGDEEADFDPHEIADEVAGNVGDEPDDDPIGLASQVKPSSMGISFMLAGASDVDVSIRAARYEDVDGDGRRWRRVPLTALVRVSRPGDRPAPDPEVVFGGAAELHSRWRDRESSLIVTVTLVNRREVRGSARIRSSDCLFQPELRCAPVEGRIVPYPARPHLHLDAEEEEMDLLFRDVPTYAIGHGVSADWPTDGGRSPGHVSTSFLPVRNVPGASFKVGGDSGVLRLDFLTGAEKNQSAVVTALRQFVDGYDAWTADLRGRADAAGSSDARHRLLDRVDVARRRMRRGVELIGADPVVREAFVLANEAMRRQMAHTRAETRQRAVEESAADRPDYSWVDASWRPFQLGFLLLTLEGTATECPDRDLVDLIWFPTGGGKTEAYLALAAFAIFHRRLLHGDRGAGTTVITRYTLRLLTAQQFQRASALICACETLREGSPERLGSTPITIGIWTGGANSPNTLAEARALAAELRAGATGTKSFQIDRCPWCGTRIVAGDEDDEETWGFYADNTTFRVNCLNPACHFFHTGLPMSSVDDALYERPPTLLIGTVDKFARAAWRREIGAFFGAGGTPGPSLIIQDEFHLISGPLGTVVGLYEAAFDVVLAANRCRPKIVASTATIRNAAEQTRGVFGRELALFPPPGFEESDSYFVRTDVSSPGRLYVGFMPQGHTPLTALVHVAAALLQAPMTVDFTAEGRDAVWTLVAYHNSLRELGKTSTLARDDIDKRMEIIAPSENDKRMLGDDNIVELTSGVPPSQIEQVLERLGRRWDDPESVSLVASTNMISVGVDVDRLGLMLVLGQPKTTAEYIQASSRVGRSPARPGTVLTLYSPSKPRDRSHYESFASYHSKLYRAVEPTSVTPFSVPARERALHAGLVVLARHARRWGADDDALSMDEYDPEFRRLVADLVDRARRADAEEAEEVRAHLDRLITEWAHAVADAEEAGGLRYQDRRGAPGLLRPFTEGGITNQVPWRTLNSMRSVDVEISIVISGERQ